MHISSQNRNRSQELTISLKIFNTLSSKKEPFTHPRGDTIKVFVCGPTVYDYAHLGHARTYIAFDMIRRYLKYLGYNVRYLMNITDVANKIVQHATEQGRDPLEFAHHFERAFREDLLALGVTGVERFERASEYIPQMIAQVLGLIRRGYAYETNTGVYFQVEKFPKYGQLSGQRREELGLRRLELCSSKLNPEDFSLWRKHEKGFGWESPWGFGRPGWHIEDTAISMTHLGDTYDLHGGASELIFPHHEAEIAQAEALTDRIPFVRCWLHTGLLSTKGRKMSKSLGNVIRIRDALKQYSAAELRYFILSHHYRQPVVISERNLNRARRELKVLTGNFKRFQTIHTLTEPQNSHIKITRLLTKAQTIFKRNMDNDFNSPRALGTLTGFGLQLSRLIKPTGSGIDELSKLQAETAFRRMANVFGILGEQDAAD